MPPADRNVSMVFQNYALFPHLDVAANIGFGLTARGMPRREVAERVAEAAKLVGCDGFLERKPFRLSGGERQRVALARALARRPDVFLLDEPLSNLDAQLRAPTRAELKALHQRVGGTTLYVTHDQVEALTLGDRIAVLRAGELQQVADPDELYRRPANRFVASFVGSPAMNFLPPGGGPFRRRRGTAPRWACVPRGVPLGAGEVEATVELVEPAGNETFVHLSVEGLRLVARVAADVRPEVGTRLSVALGPRLALLRPRDRRARRMSERRGLALLLAPLPARARGPGARPGRDHLLARAVRVRPDPFAGVDRTRELPRARRGRDLPHRRCGTR